MSESKESKASKRGRSSARKRSAEASLSLEKKQRKKQKTSEMPETSKTSKTSKTSNDDQPEGQDADLPVYWLIQMRASDSAATETWLAPPQDITPGVKKVCFCFSGVPFQQCKTALL